MTKISENHIEKKLLVKINKNIEKKNAK